MASVPGTLLLEKAVTGLNKTFIVNFSQIAALDKTDLTDLVGMLPRQTLDRAVVALKKTLDIP